MEFKERQFVEDQRRVIHRIHTLEIVGIGTDGRIFGPNNSLWYDNGEIDSPNCGVWYLAMVDMTEPSYGDETEMRWMVTDLDSWLPVVVIRKGGVPRLFIPDLGSPQELDWQPTTMSQTDRALLTHWVRIFLASLGL